MKNNFEDSLKYVLIHEGGWADHPRDPGGATMKGVTLITYRRYFGEDKGKDDLRAISDEELLQIYDSGYWSKCRCDELPAGIDFAVFDAAVNSGPSRGVKWLQAAVGAKQDGGMGPKTLAKVKEYQPQDVLHHMCDNRLAFLRGLATWTDFGVGWSRRVENVRATAMKMAGGEGLSIPEVVPSVDYEIVRLGSSGVWVTNLQKALKIHVDGKFGKDTEKALIEWQRENGLASDGIAGRITWRALGILA